MRLITLGAPGVLDDDGRPLELPIGKPFAALCYLTLDGDPVRRDALGTLLWPDVSEDRARGSVRQALWLLRKYLGPGTIREDERGLSVGPALETDLQELEAALIRLDLRRALELWKEGPLRSLDITGAPRWRAWRDDLHSSWERRVGELVEARASSSAGEERVEWFRAARDLRPYRPAPHVGLVRSLLDLGRGAEAERALSVARLDLHSPRDRADLSEVEGRLKAVLRGRLVEEGDPAEAPPLELVGRGREFSRLTDAMRRTATEGVARCRLLSGPDGIGKTRLLEDAGALAEQDGFTVVGTRARPGDETLDYSLLADLVRTLSQEQGAPGVSRRSERVLRYLLPSAVGAEDGIPGDPPPGAALVDAVLDLVDAVAHEAPLLVAVDDLQWADTRSRAVLSRVVRASGRTPAVFLLTLRAGTRASAVERAGSFLLDPDDLIHLHPLAEAAVRELLSHAADPAAEPEIERLSGAVAAACGGNPGLIADLLDELAEAGHLGWEGARWTVSREVLGGEVDLQGIARHRIRGRLRGLSGQARMLGGEIARSARPDGGAEPRASGGLTRPGTEGALEELLASGLVVPTEQGRLRPLGSMVGRVLEAEVPPAPTRVRGVWIPAAVAAVASLVLLAWAGIARETPALEGRLRLLLDGLYTVEVWEPTGPRGGWARTASFTSPADTLFPAHPAADASGRTLWIGRTGSQERAPDVVLWEGHGSEPELLLDRGGDDVLASVSPDGRFAVVASEDTAAATFRQDLLLVDLHARAHRVLFSAPALAIGGLWTPGGGRILAGANYADAPDSVFVLRPDGSVEERLATPEGDLLTVQPCGEDLVAGVLPSGRPERLYTARWDDATRWVPAFGGRDVPGTWSCHPGGRELLVVDEGTGASRLRLLDRESLEELAEYPVGRPVQHLSWSPRPRPLPVEFHLPTGEVEMSWGGRRSLTGTTVLSDGDTAALPVAWQALDPGVVSVRGDTAIANRPGPARLVGTVDGWLSDTLAVTVTRGETPSEALLLAPAPDLGSEEGWQLLGDVRITPAGDSALILESDPQARYVDGIMRRGLPAELGLTAELEFRLPLSRTDRQSISLCLAEHVTPDEDADRSWRQSWRRLQEACGVYPAWQLARFDASEARLHLRPYALGGVPVSGLPTDGWVQMGLQVRADGQVDLVMNREIVSTHPERLRLREGLTLDLLIQARTAETELTLRNLAVWRGGRY